MPDNLLPHPDKCKIPLGYWKISGAHLMQMLEKVQAGERPGTVYAEYYANCHRKDEEF